MVDLKEAQNAAGSQLFQRQRYMSIGELDKRNAARVAENINAGAACPKNDKTSLEQMPFVRLSRRLIPAIGKEILEGRNLTISDALIIGYVHTSQLVGHACHASRAYMACDLGMNRSRVSSALNVLFDAGLMKLGEDGCLIIVEAVAKLVGYTGPEDKSDSWLGSGEFLRVPLWFLSKKKTTPTEALVLGDELALSLLKKPRKPVSADKKAKSLGVTRNSLIRARKTLVEAGLLEAMPSPKRKTPVSFSIPESAIEVARPLEEERIKALQALRAKSPSGKPKTAK